MCLETHNTGNTTAGKSTEQQELSFIIGGDPVTLDNLVLFCSSFQNFIIFYEIQQLCSLVFQKEKGGGESSNHVSHKTYT